jgi:hypothetical protein
MTSRDSSSAFRWVGLALLVIGVFGAVIAYKQCARAQGQFARAQSSLVDNSIMEDSVESAPTRSTELVAPAAASASPSGVSSARTAATARPEIDWESLVERTPEAALQQLKVGVPRDDVEAQRFSVYEVRALTKLQRMGEARARAEAYFERWPSGPDIVYLQSLTGAHPRPKGDLDGRP